MSLDAKIAGASDCPVIITGEIAQQFTHQCRLRSDAILSSAKTIKMDNPSLNVRINGEEIAKPLYIVDTSLSLPLGAKVFDTAAKITVFHACSDEDKINQFIERGIDCHKVDKIEQGLNLNQVVEIIGNHGVQDLWVEAGGKIFSSLIDYRIANRALIYIAPKLLGESARTAFSQKIELFQAARAVEWFHLGKDIACDIELDT